MSNITNSNKNSEYQLDTVTPVIDNTGQAMIVGNKYEMYAPAAKQARDSGFGLVWHDNVGFSFTYDGVIDLHGCLYIATRDVNFNEAVVPPEVYESSLAITELFGTCTLCPVKVAARVIRPATDA